MVDDRPGRWRWWLGAGAAVAAVVGLLLWWRGSGGRTTKPARPAAPIVLPERTPAPLDVIAPRGDIATRPDLSWQPATNAVGYRVSAFTASGQALFTRDVVATALPWPASIPTPPGEYRWKVEGRDARGVVAASPLETFRILP